MCTVKKYLNQSFPHNLKNEKRYRKIFSDFETNEKRLLCDKILAKIGALLFFWDRKG